MRSLTDVLSLFLTAGEALLPLVALTLAGLALAPGGEGRATVAARLALLALAGSLAAAVVLGAWLNRHL